jgi:hypothetical protein
MRVDREDREDPASTIGAPASPVRRAPLARGTCPPEAASLELLRRVSEALFDARFTAVEAVVRVIRWSIDELEAFERETGVSPGHLFQPGLVRGVLGLSSGLASRAIDAVGAAASDRLIAAGARSLRPMSRVFGGSDAVIEQAMAGLAVAGRRTRDGLSLGEADALLEWAAAEKRHAERPAPRPGSLSRALITMWLVRNADGPWQPRGGVDPDRWRDACARIFGVDHLPPRLLARLQLEAIWIDMGLAIGGSVDWPAAGTGAGTARFHDAANPRALAASLEGHSSDGARYRHLAGGGQFELTFRFAVRERPDGASELAELDYDLSITTS